MDSRSRLIYEYITVEEKKEVVALLKQDREELSKVYKSTGYKYPKIIKQVINDTLDKWDLDINELNNDIQHNIGRDRQL